jgi:hypothetical protein
VRAAGFSRLLVTSFVTLLLPVMALSRWRQRLTRREHDVLADLTPGALINGVFERILALERMAIKRKVNLPIGGSLVT